MTSNIIMHLNVRCANQDHADDTLVSINSLLEKLAEDGVVNDADGQGWEWTFTYPHYEPMRGAATHTCWDDEENYDGLVDFGLDNGCTGCEQAERHPCRWCGYGGCFTTHSPEAHVENGDPDAPDPFTVGPEWTDVPHIYRPA